MQAKARGVVFIHQELSLADELSVAENIWLGELPLKSFGRVDWGKLYADTDAILKTLNVSFDARTRVGDLSIANQQMVEIARALTVDPRAVIFDEPTASLTDAEKVVLFKVIADLQSRGVGIIYISHRMEEIFKITDRISVLRDGQYRGTLDTAETDEEAVTQLMIGRKLDLSRNESHHEMGDVALEVRGLSCGHLFRDVSFTVRRGEVVGFYGLVGAGRTEIAETIFGLRDPSEGQILLGGQEVRIHSPIEAIARGISLVPEDRKGQGLVLGMNCRDNMTLPQVDDLTAGPFVSDGAEISIFDQYRDKLDIRTPGWRQTVGNLSGGNQQKIVIGKWLSMHPEVLIVDEPTRGIDVGLEIRDPQPDPRPGRAGLCRHRHQFGNARGAACLRPHRRDVLGPGDAHLHFGRGNRRQPYPGDFRPGKRQGGLTYARRICWPRPYGGPHGRKPRGGRA